MSQPAILTANDIQREFNLRKHKANRAARDEYVGLLKRKRVKGVVPMFKVAMLMRAV